MSSSGLLGDWSSLSSSFSLTSGWFWVVSMLTTAGSTRLAISANEAESASGARATWSSGCAMVGWPDSIAPMPIPATKQAIASAAIQTRSFLRMVRSCSEVLLLERSNIFHHLREKSRAQRKGLEYSERVFYLLWRGVLGAEKDFQNAFDCRAPHRMDAFRQRILFTD